MEKIQADAQICKHCGSILNSTKVQQQPQFQQTTPIFRSNVNQQQALPPGISGWSWGAALLNWIWAIGNKVWIGLLAIVPGLNIVMFFVLGIKGREWAWKSGLWESVDHFNYVQRKWSKWAIGISIASLFVAVITVIFSIGGDSDSQKFMWMYLNCIATKNDNKCKELVGVITSNMPYDTANINLDKLCVKYNVKQACIDPPIPSSVKADEYFQNQPAVQKQPGAEPQPNEQITFAPSFDCIKASTAAERMICSNSELAQVDVRLAQAYKVALNKSSNKPALKKEQGAWIRNQRDSCSDAGAMLQVYQDRILQLSR